MNVAESDRNQPSSLFPPIGKPLVIDRGQIPVPQKNFFSEEATRICQRLFSTTEPTARSNLISPPDIQLIWQAIHSRDLLNLRHHLQNISDINILMIPGKDYKGRPATLSCMHWAIHYRDYDMIQYLIEEKGARVDFAARLDTNEGYDIWQALKRPFLELENAESQKEIELVSNIIKYLESHGASVNQSLFWKHGTRGPIISTIIRNMHFRHIQLLLESTNIDVNQKDSLGRSPLYHALNLYSSSSCTDVESHRKIESILEILDDYDADIEDRDAEGNTLLMQFARLGNLEAVRWLLSCPADVKARNLKGENALDCALEALLAPSVASSFLDIAKSLTSYETIESLNEKLKRQISLKNAKAILFLCKKGADINCRDENGDTPLICLAKSADPIFLQSLLMLTPDKNARDASGQTALTHLLARLESLEENREFRSTLLEIIEILQM